MAASGAKTKQIYIHIAFRDFTKAIEERLEKNPNTSEDQFLDIIRQHVDKIDLFPKEEGEQILIIKK